jgi:hypothetical protein
MIVSDILHSALTRMGELPPNLPIPADWSAMALTELNAMLQDWAVEGMQVHALTTYTMTLTSGQAVYTIGTGGDVAVRRPVEIVDAVLTYTQSGGTDWRRLEVYNSLFRYRQYNQFPTALPREVYYDPQFALGTLTFYYTPDSNYPVALTAVVSQVPFVAVTDTINLPPEYESALGMNLAVRLLPSFNKVHPLLVDQARELKATLLTNNSKRRLRDHVLLDSALTGVRNSDNILTGWL